jgi:hypothetical protein
MEHTTNSQYRILSGSWLKLIAAITMLIDHIGAFLLRNTGTGDTLLLSVGTFQLTVYALTRDIGRTAFPIYCFLIAEGCRHTHSRKRYAARLLIFALLSEIPWNLVHSGKLLYERQNVFFTLLLGCLCICTYEHYRQQPAKCTGCFALLIAAAFLLKSDYGIKGVALVFLFHIVSSWLPQLLIGISLLGTPWKGIPAWILIRLYNGTRGFIKGKWTKYSFYAFYPLHLFVLYFVKYH